MPESESLIAPDLVRLDAALGSTKAEVSAQLAEIVTSAGRATDTAGLIADIQAREAQAPTGLPGGIGIRTADPSTSLRPPWPSPDSRRRSTSALRTGPPI